MSDNRKYYYLKLKENFYNSETMVILESMQDGLLYSNLLLKMYLMSLKSGGILMLNDHLPHTPQTIATFTRHQVGTVERALKVFLEFGLVEILTDGAYYMTDIQLLIGQSSTEGERKKKERMRLKRQKLLPSGGADICPPYSQGDICPPEIRDKRLDIRDKSIENRESESAHAYGRYQNVFLTDGELADLQASFPTVWGQYIEKLSEYMASTGKRYQSHAATIRRWAGEDAKKTITPSRNPMKRMVNVLCAGVLAMTVLSCGEEKKGYTLNGEISDVKDGMVYLKKYQDKSFIAEIGRAHV